MCKYVVVDLEMCDVPKERRTKKYHWAMETIQIGAVLLDENLEIIDEFSTFVSPQLGYVNTRISQLTGIKNKDVVKAPVFKDALKLFYDWIPDDAVVVSWSENDEMQIRREIKGKDIVFEGEDDLFEDWIDCQKKFSDRMNNDRCYRLQEALIAADIIYDEGAHNGLVDARNTAKLFAKMEREPKLVLNAYYEKAISDEEEFTGSTIASLLSGIDLSAFAVA